MDCTTIGKTSMILAMASGEDLDRYLKNAEQNKFRICIGQAGSMEFKKIVAAIETAAINEGLISKKYWQKHALYHACIEAFHGICRGELELGTILRTVGLRFVIVRGPRNVRDTGDGEWIAVALYGHMGAPIKGCEHEVVGLGINHI
ncbi:MAG: HutP family protein [Dethiobacteria bacterium]|jgi:hut operon positive regulator|nr:hut operon transcriptional regulator HutP [Bacillota bacterium]